MILHYEAQLYLLRSLVGRTFKAGGYTLYGLVTLLCDRQVKLLLIPFNLFVTAVNVTSCFSAVHCVNLSVYCTFLWLGCWYNF